MNFPRPYPLTLGLMLLATPLLRADILYGVTEIGSLAGSRGSIATAINNAGQIVGYSEYSPGSGDHAFVDNNGQIQDLGFLPGGDSSAAFAINNVGQITGQATPSAGAPVPFYYSNGQMQQIGPSLGASGSGSAINDRGQVTGAIVQDGVHAFLYSNGTFQDLGRFLFGDYSVGVGINNAGQVAGWTQLRGGPPQSFIYSNGNVTYLGILPGYTSAEAVGINNRGQVVGTISSLSGGPLHVFRVH
jgi:probable HAF family extracellular repeat protein